MSDNPYRRMFETVQSDLARVHEAKRRALAIADERSKENVGLRAEVKRQAAEIERLRAAMTPGAETKAAYIGEFFIKVVVDHDELGDDITMQIPIEWTTIKEIMAAI